MTEKEKDDFLEKAHYESWLIHIAQEQEKSLRKARSK